jgi:tRNA pseudouridine55 synthase
MSKRPSLSAGFLSIDKPAGITSHDVIMRVRKVMEEYAQKVGLPAEAQRAKAGHAGTLDPFATGVLLILIGSAARLVEYVHLLPKEYEAEIILGAMSDTDDATGNIQPQAPDKIITTQHLNTVLKKCTGTLQQVPPLYAAIKVKGKKLYEYARSGKKVERQARTVIIQKIELLEYAYPKLRIAVTCSAGTYIRALARDIGHLLQTGAYLHQLRRTAIGPFSIKNALSLDALTPENISAHLQPSPRLVNHLISVILSNEEIVNIKHGKALAAPTPLPEDQPLTLLNQQQTLIGIGRYDVTARTIRPEKILV